MRKIVAAVIVTVFIGTAAHAGLTEYLDTVGTPTDGGAGPALWYKTARSPNDGSGGGSHTLTSGGAMTDLAIDFWGNADSAYGLDSAAAGGAAVVGSTGAFVAGANGTVSFLFKTPETLSGFTSLFNQGSYADASPFELGINVNVLRLTTMDGATKKSTNLGTLSPDTWYYFCMRWDTSLPSDGLAWYYGTAGSSLNSGAITITASGDPAKPVYAGGRAIGNVFAGGFFQSIAVYERTLSDSAVQSQFDETVSGSILPSDAYAKAVGTPIDDGDGPALWYKTARSPNDGSAGASHVLTSGGPMTVQTNDFWGNADSAYGLVSTASGGAAVSGSSGLFTSGTNGTFSFLFKTPTNLPAFAVMFNQTQWGGDSQLEVAVHNGALRLGTQNNNLEGEEAWQTDYCGAVSGDTWYYFGATWDLSVSNLTWYFGEAGDDSLGSGAVTVTSAGSSIKPLYIGGRVVGRVFEGAFYQHVAVYERTLSGAAMQAQFDAMPIPLGGDYAAFTDFYGITGEPNSAPEEDYDGDGQLNVYEYGLGGDPTDPADVGTEPTFSYGTDHQARFRNVILTDPTADIAYFVEQTDNLAIGAWTNSGWNLVSTNATGDAAFDEVLHRISGDQENLFIRLRITQP